MAFDGITIAAVVKELKDKAEGGRIYKIAQPEKDELLLTITGSDSSDSSSANSIVCVSASVVVSVFLPQPVINAVQHSIHDNAIFSLIILCFM